MKTVVQTVVKTVVKTVVQTEARSCSNATDAPVARSCSNAMDAPATVVRRNVFFASVFFLGFDGLDDECAPLLENACEAKTLVK